MISVFIAGCTAPPEPEMKTYVIGIDGYCPPFTYIDTEGEAAGFDVEAAKWIAHVEGFNVEFIPVVWGDIIPALERGDIDMIYSGFTITPEREQVVDFTYPYWKLNQGVAVREDSDITMANIFTGNAVIGILNASSGEVWLQKNLENYEQRVADNSIVIYNSFPMLMIALQNRGCDAAIMDEVSFASYLPGKPLKQIGIIETGEEYGIAVRKGDTELRQMMNSGIAKLQTSEKWQELIDKYIVSATPDAISGHNP
jgi:polar amino acid transport system substrate-binding protein